MKRLTLILALSAGLMGCHWFSKEDVPEAKEVVRLNLNEPVLNLDRFKDLQWVLDNGKVCLDIRQFQTMDELLGVLQNHIAEQKQIITEYKQYYEPEK